MATIGDTLTVPSTTITVGTDTIYPTSVQMEFASESEVAAHMQDNKRQAYLTSHTRTVTIEWVAPEAPSLKPGDTATVTITAGASTLINALSMRVKSLSLAGRARELWRGTLVLELMDETLST